MSIDADALGPLVQSWLGQQRWFAGKGRELIATVRLVSELPGGIEIWTVRADYADGESEVYQLPLVAHGEPSESLEHVLLGTVTTTQGPRWVYDALHDKDVTPALLTGIRDEQTIGPVHFVRYAGAADIPVGEHSLALTGEQSNTSLMFGDLALLKMFRRLQPGTNPDIEIHSALGELGARHVARLLGSVHADIDGEPFALGMLQEFMTTATDGWELANISVRDLMAERDLHADEAGGDFAAEAFRLGAAVAETHSDLVTAFGSSDSVAAGRAGRADRMQARLTLAVSVVPELAELAEPLREIFAAVASAASLPAQRIHGDLHLGQALRTAHRWVLIDFEGEPMLDLATRRLPDSPLRDIAGMLRSFEYAGYHRLVDGPVDPQLAYRADEWVHRNRAAFCDGYAGVASFDPREDAMLLRAFEADKAVYEAMYEARNRPSWLPIALASLNRVVSAEVSP